MSATMLDRNGRPVTVGARVQFKMDSRKWPVIGIVRKIGPSPYHKSKRLEARCDDGDPTNPDLLTNGFTCSAIVTSKEIEVIDAPVIVLDGGEVRDA